jgi:hypothetical protein
MNYAFPPEIPINRVRKATSACLLNWQNKIVKCTTHKIQKERTPHKNTTNK